MQHCNKIHTPKEKWLVSQTELPPDRVDPMSPVLGSKMALNMLAGSMTWVLAAGQDHT
jgi:hypothetical protein